MILMHLRVLKYINKRIGRTEVKNAENMPRARAGFVDKTATFDPLRRKAAKKLSAAYLRCPKTLHN